MFRTLSRALVIGLGAIGLGAQTRAPVTVPAQSPKPNVVRDALHAPGSDVKVYLLTMGNGPHVWEMFGHSSIWIRDTVTMRDTVVNWGVFDRDQPNFIPHFLKGLMLYSVGGNRMADVLYSYRYWDRSVTSQELDLSATQKDSLLHIMRTNFLPENVNYRYDYFVDNCATKPRDILDRVLGGQLRIGADSVTNTSYRFHALRLMQSNLPLVLGVDLGLGEPSDRPITKWQEMFLPRKLHDWVATRQIRDSTGAVKPLVLSDRVLFQSSRPPEPEAPPAFGWLWLAGGIVAAGFLALGVAAYRSHGARVAAAVLMTIWASVCGILGVLVAALWAFTDHRFAHANENILLFHPLWLIVAVSLPMTLMSGRARALTTRLLALFVGLGVLALLLHPVGLSRQANLPIIGFALLPAIALVMVARRAT
jgi:hypothetical protein